MQSVRKSMRLAPAVLAMGAMFMFAAVPQVRAEDHKECQEHIQKAQAKLDRAIAKHGERSPDAEHARQDLNAERDRCWNKYHGYWGADNRWHDQRDWEDHH